MSLLRPSPNALEYSGCEELILIFISVPDDCCKSVGGRRGVLVKSYHVLRPGSHSRPVGVHDGCEAAAFMETL